MNKLILAAGFAAVMASCGVSNAEFDEGQGDDDASAELSTTKDTFIRLRRDIRRCVSPMCGGYWVRDLNSTMQEKYVSGLDFTGSFLDEAEQLDAVNGGEDTILFGRLGPSERRFNTRTFKVVSAFRGLPGNTLDTSDKFYGVGQTKIACFTTPCANLQATRLNRATGHVMATEVDISAAQKTLVDGSWLMNRVLQGRAVVAGEIVKSRGVNVVLHASQIYIQLPDQTQSCPRVAAPRCRNGEIAAWSRNENRCNVPVGCTPPGVCAAFVPSCDPGYINVSFQNICTRWVCEPEFLHD